MSPTTTPVRRQRTYVPTGEVGRRLNAAGDLIHRIQELEAELSAHRDWLLKHLQARNLDNITQGDITVTRKVRHKWTYSSQTEREALALRTTQKWEQLQGIAVDSPTVYIAITTPKKKS